LLGHNDTLDALGDVLGQTAPVMNDIADFLTTQGVPP